MHFRELRFHLQPALIDRGSSFPLQEFKTWRVALHLYGVMLLSLFWRVVQSGPAAAIKCTAALTGLHNDVVIKGGTFAYGGRRQD